MVVQQVLQKIPNAVMNPITGDGVQTTFLVDNDKIPTKANDVIIIRKFCDGSFIPILMLMIHCYLVVIWYTQMHVVSQCRRNCNRW